MKDHPRLLGNLFLAWAVAQVISLLILLAVSPNRAELPALVWVLSGVSALAYGGVGYLLRQHSPQARIPAILLSGLALFSFPIGTALGIYGLWALLRPREARVGP